MRATATLDRKPGRARRVSACVWMVLASCVWITPAMPGHARGGEAEIARFSDEFPPAAKRLMEAAGRARGTGQVTELPPDREPLVDEFRFANDHGYRKLELFRERVTGDPDKPWYVVCLWEGGGYELSWSPETSSYQVAHAGPLLPKDFATRFSYSHRFGRFFKAPYSVSGSTVSEILERPETHIAGAEEAIVNGHSCIRVALETVLKTGSSIPFEVTVDLAPDLGWAVVGFESQISTMPPSRQNITYATTGGDVPELAEVSIIEFLKPGLPETSATRWRCRFDSIEHEPTPVEDFSMGHYGLPVIAGPSMEPGDVVEDGANGTPRAVWIVGLSVLGLTTSALLWRAGRRPSVG